MKDGLEKQRKKDIRITEDLNLDFIFSSEAEVERV